jgi:hypothetical protein
MNIHTRTKELDELASAVLSDLGLAMETDHIKLHPAVEKLQARAGCQLATARRVIARNIRKQHGLIVNVGGLSHQVVSVTNLPGASDHGQDIPLVTVAPLEQ